MASPCYDQADLRHADTSLTNLPQTKNQQSWRDQVSLQHDPNTRRLFTYQTGLPIRPTIEVQEPFISEHSAILSSRMTGLVDYTCNEQKRLVDGPNRNLPLLSRKAPRVQKRRTKILHTADWEPHKTRILDLHISQKLSLPQVKGIMEDQYGFSAEYVGQTMRTVQEPALTLELLQNTTIPHAYIPVGKRQKYQVERDGSYCSQAPA